MHSEIHNTKDGKFSWRLFDGDGYTLEEGVSETEVKAREALQAAAIAESNRVLQEAMENIAKVQVSPALDPEEKKKLLEEIGVSFDERPVFDWQEIRPEEW